MRTFIKYRLQEENAGDGKDAGAGGTGDASSDENNNLDKVDDYSSVWDNDTSAAVTPDVAEVRIVNQPDVVEQTPAEKLAKHIEGLNLSEGFNYEAMNNPETAQAEIQRMQATTYEAIIKDANQIMDQRITALREEMQQDNINTINGNDSINKMNVGLPYTAKPAFKPVADALLVKFQNKGLTVDKAVIEIGKYFQNLQKEVASTLPKPPSNRIGGQVFNDVNDPNSGEADTDWVDFLSAK